jgi:hypothetical protein
MGLWCTMKLSLSERFTVLLTREFNNNSAISNLRSVSVMNVVYKILSHVLSARLIMVLNHIRLQDNRSKSLGKLSRIMFMSIIQGFKNQLVSSNEIMKELSIELTTFIFSKHLADWVLI